jgi:hypothetical protein
MNSRPLLRRPMQTLARWHIWLGWAVAIPLLLWCASGLLMVARPIEEVRGEHLRIKRPMLTIEPGAVVLPAAFTKPAKSLTITLEPYGPVTRVELVDGGVARYDAAGLPLRDFNELAARQLVKESIVGGDKVRAVTLYPKDKVPLDFRKPMPVWQVSLEDGTHVYVGKETGRIEAVRTPFWRLYDFMWGLHIMDPAAREDTHHPLLIGFAALALVSVVFGTALLFRRRRTAK